MTLGASYGPQPTAAACRGGFYWRAPGSITQMGTKQQWFPAPKLLYLPSGRPQCLSRHLADHRPRASRSRNDRPGAHSGERGPTTLVADLPGGTLRPRRVANEPAPGSALRHAETT